MSGGIKPISFNKLPLTLVYEGPAPYTPGSSIDFTQYLNDVGEFLYGPANPLSPEATNVVKNHNLLSRPDTVHSATSLSDVPDDWAQAYQEATESYFLYGGGIFSGRSPKRNMAPDKTITQGIATAIGSRYDHAAQYEAAVETIRTWLRKLPQNIVDLEKQQLFKNIIKLTAPILYAISNIPLTVFEGGLLLLHELNLIPDGTLKKFAINLLETHHPAKEVTGKTYWRAESNVATLMMHFKAVYNHTHNIPPPQTTVEIAESELMNLPAIVLEVLSTIEKYEYLGLIRALGIRDPEEQ